MLRKLVFGAGMALLASCFMATGASAQTASQCTSGDRECIREQVIFNISNGDPLLNNVPLTRVGIGGAPVDFNFQNNPQFAAALSRANFSFSATQLQFINGFIGRNGAALFNRLSGLGGGIYLTLINNLLIRAGAMPIP